MKSGTTDDGARHRCTASTVKKSLSQIEIFRRDGLNRHRLKSRTSTGGECRTMKCLLQTTAKFHQLHHNTPPPLGHASHMLPPPAPLWMAHGLYMGKQTQGLRNPSRWGGGFHNKSSHIFSPSTIIPHKIWPPLVCWHEPCPLALLLVGRVNPLLGPFAPRAVNIGPISCNDGSFFSHSYSHTPLPVTAGSPSLSR